MFRIRHECEKSLVTYCSLSAVSTAKWLSYYRIERRSTMSCYYGSKIFGSQQSFLTETAICIVERCKKNMDYCLVPERNHAHPRRPRGSQSGREKRRDETFQVRAKEPLGTDSHWTISKNSSGCRLLIGYSKCFVLLCPIGEHILMSSFRVFVHDGYCLDHGLSILCTKEMHAVRKLSVWYKFPIWSNSLTLSNACELFWTISKFMKRMNFVIACLLLRKTWS